MVVQGAEEGGLTATIMREDEDEGPFLAAVTPLSRAVVSACLSRRSRRPWVAPLRDRTG